MQAETTPKFLDLEPHIRQARGTAEALLAGLSEERHLLEGAAEALARQTEEVFRIWHAAQRAQAIKLHPAQPLSAQEITSKQLAVALGRLDSLTSTLSCLAATEAPIEDVQASLSTADSEARLIADELEVVQLALRNADSAAAAAVGTKNPIKDETGYFRALNTLQALHGHLMSCDGHQVAAAETANVVELAIDELQRSVVI